MEPSFPTPPLPPPAPESPDNTRNWLMGLHLSGLAGLTGIPFANILAPLIIWLMKKDTSREIDTQGKQALNFQISIAIYMAVSFVLMWVLIGFLTFVFALILWIYGIIKAAMDVNKGLPVRYPLTIPFLK